MAKKDTFSTIYRCDAEKLLQGIAKCLPNHLVGRAFILLNKTSYNLLLGLTFPMKRRSVTSLSAGNGPWGVLAGFLITQVLLVDPQQIEPRERASN